MPVLTQVAVRIADREAEALQEAGLIGFGAGGGGAVGRRGSERALRVLPGVFRACLLRPQGCVQLRQADWC